MIHSGPIARNPSEARRGNDRIDRSNSARHIGSFIGVVCTSPRRMIVSGRTVWPLPIRPGNAAERVAGSSLERLGREEIVEQCSF
jgi:hypothetical protein